MQDVMGVGRGPASGKQYKRGWNNALALLTCEEINCCDGTSLLSAIELARQLKRTRERTLMPGNYYCTERLAS